MSYNESISVEEFIKKQNEGKLFARVNLMKSSEKCIDFESKCGLMVYKSEYWPGVEENKLAAYASTTFFELSDIFNRLKYGSLITVLDFKEFDNEVANSVIKEDIVNKGCFKIDNYRVKMNKSLEVLETYIWLVEYFDKNNTFSMAQEAFRYHEDSIKALIDDEVTLCKIKKLMRL